MTRQRRQLALLGVLLVVMAAVYARPPRHRAPGAAPAPAAGDAGRAPAGAEGVPPLDAPASDQRTAQRARAAGLRWARDPFIRGGSAGELSGLTVSGILWSQKTPIAIINSQMVRVGDELDGYRILSIRQDSVDVTDGTDTIQLTITP